MNDQYLRIHESSKCSETQILTATIYHLQIQVNAYRHKYNLLKRRLILT